MRGDVVLAKEGCVAFRCIFDCISRNISVGGVWARRFGSMDARFSNGLR